jgi:hypothetical protein
MSEVLDTEYSYRKFENIHAGETAIIIGNGPGLASVPVEFLRKYPSFGCNRITQMYPGFVPTYYSCIGMNQLMKPEQRVTIYPAILDDRCEAAFINRLMIHHFRHPKVFSILSRALYLPGLPAMEKAGFSSDPLNQTGIGATQTFIALQIAFYMGFETALIVGMDYGYPGGPQKHFYKDEDVPEFEVAPGRHYKNNAQWQAASDIVMNNALVAYTKSGRKIVNLSEPTECTIFERGRIEDW